MRWLQTSLKHKPKCYIVVGSVPDYRISAPRQGIDLVVEMEREEAWIC